MDAIKFINEHKRMCASYTRCKDCSLYKANILCSEIPSHYPDEFAAELTKAVEAWSAAHPLTTRADWFKKTCPNVATYPDGTIRLCPHDIDESFECPPELNCFQCKKIYWGQEVKK